jgi:hypothetical protein
MYKAIHYDHLNTCQTNANYYFPKQQLFLFVCFEQKLRQVRYLFVIEEKALVFTDCICMLKGKRKLQQASGCFVHPVLGLITGCSWSNSTALCSWSLCCTA